MMLITTTVLRYLDMPAVFSHYTESVDTKGWNCVQDLYAYADACVLNNQNIDVFKHSEGIALIKTFPEVKKFGKVIRPSCIEITNMELKCTK